MKLVFVSLLTSLPGWMSPTNPGGCGMMGRWMEDGTAVVVWVLRDRVHGVKDLDLVATRVLDRAFCPR